MSEIKNRAELSELLDVHDLQNHFPFSRTMAYSCLNNPACGVICIGRRKFIHRDTFLRWLESQRISDTEVN